MTISLTRRAFVVGAPLALAGCMSSLRQPIEIPAPLPTAPQIPDYYLRMYGPVLGEPYPVDAADLSRVDPQFWRQEAFYPTPEPTGTIVVDTAQHFLYLVGEGGRAMRYGIGVGREGLAFEGVGTIQMKREWPRWTPTAAMVAREPERYGPLAAGMEPGPTNPLGPRALYLFKDGRDTLYRIHGTTEDWSIGQSISSGCIRLLNQDIIDLYGRVPTGSRVVVVQSGGFIAAAY